MIPFFSINDRESIHKMRTLAGLYFVIFLTLWDDKVGKSEAAQSQGSPALSGSSSSERLPITTTDPGVEIPVTPSQATAANCRKKPIEISFQPAGCEKKDLSGKMCIGTCTSFYIPTEAGPFENYKCCAPSGFETKSLSFTCPGKSPPGGVTVKAKFPRKCTCTECALKDWPAWWTSNVVPGWWTSLSSIVKWKCAKAVQ